MAGLQDNALRIVLVGRTGCGKSATANTILGERVFDSRISTMSVTKSCQKASRAWKGRVLVVVDTPGFFDTKETLETSWEKVRESVVLTHPGPHAIILVVKLGYFTDEEYKAVELIKATFGERAMKHMIILFTHKDHLEENQMLSDFMAKADKRLKSVIVECDLRCCAFNNRSADEAEREAQVQELMQVVEATVQENGGAHFSDSRHKGRVEKPTGMERAVKKNCTIL